MGNAQTYLNCYGHCYYSRGGIFLSGYAGQEDADPVTALNQLTRYLFGYYGKRVFILSDEYDTPLQETYVYGYWKELRLMNRLSLSS